MIRAPAPPRRARVRPCSATALARLVLLALPLLAGCSNSKLIVGAFYDRADDRAIDGAAEWATLDAAQQAALEGYVGTFHTWHRRSELPRYAALLGDMSETLSEYGASTEADWTRWFRALDARVGAVRECHPARFATDTLRTLTPAQVDQIEAHRAEERAEREERYGNRTRAERIERRVANVDKWSGRLGLELDRRQLDMIEDAFERQTSLGAEYRALSAAWYDELYALLRAPDAPDFASRLDAHVARWFTMLEDAHPDRWEANRELWRDFAVDFEPTLSSLQRRDATRWLAKMGTTLDAISRDRPDYLPADDPSFGCIATGAGGNAANG